MGSCAAAFKRQSTLGEARTKAMVRSNDSAPQTERDDLHRRWRHARDTRRLPQGLGAHGLESLDRLIGEARPAAVVKVLRYAHSVEVALRRQPPALTGDVAGVATGRDQLAAVAACKPDIELIQQGVGVFLRAQETVPG